MNDAIREAATTCLDELKVSTWSLHKALEAQIPFPQSFATLQSYEQVLSVFYLFQLSLDKYAQHYRQTIHADFEFDTRQRLPLITEDMRSLAVPLPQDNGNVVLQLDSVGEMYGAMYVNEGSTMGGHIIQSAMFNMYGESAASWTRYLNPYSSEMMPMWHSFRRVLQAEIESDNVRLVSVITGAEKTFRYLIDVAEEQGFKATL